MDLSIEFARAVVIYSIALITMSIVYAHYLSKEKALAVLSAIFFSSAIGPVISFYLVEYVIGSSLAEIGIILASMCIVCILSLISLLRKREDLSLTFANIVTFLFFLPIIFDWLIIPTISVETLGGKIFWQFIQIVLSVVLSYFLNKIIKIEK